MSEAKKDDKAPAEGLVKEEDLLKSLNELEAKQPEADEKKDETVETTVLEKTAKDVVEETASEDLKKAIDASSVLREFTGLMGSHVDKSLEQLQKSIQGSAERDLAVIRVLEGLKKSIDDNTAAIKAFGQEPGKPAADAGVTVTKDEVLEKTAKDDKTVDGKKPDPAATRKQVLVGLESLAKTAADAGDMQTAQQIGHATAKFESAGEITDELLAKAINAAGARKAAAVV